MSSEKIILNVKKREITGKKVASLREEGQVPAIVYGKGFEPINIQSDYLELARVVREAGTHTPVELNIDGTKQAAIVKDYDMDYVKNQINHISFQAISADEVITTEVPIVLVAFEDSEAAKAGLEIMQAVRDIEIKAKPADLPQQLEVSASNAREHGDKLLVSDIKLPEGVVLAYPDDVELTVANIVDPAIEAAKQEAAEKAAAEAEAETTESDQASEAESAQGESEGNTEKTAE